jgi:hypothetical protein
MSIEFERATIPCTVCGARVTELRRGRCWGCYSKWAEARPVGRGAVCVICSDRRREHLRMIEIKDRSLCMCHGCATRTVKLSSVPASIEQLRSLLSRDRRGEGRRGDNLDRRLYPRERRVGDRRGPPRAGARGDTDPFMAMPVFDDAEIEIDEGDIEVMEVTVVRERPLSLR